MGSLAKRKLFGGSGSLILSGNASMFISFVILIIFASTAPFTYSLKKQMRLG